MNVLPNYGSNIVPSTHHLINISIFDDSQSSTIWHHTQAIYGHRDGVDENDFIKGDL